jgi:hypothetical protein
MKIPKKCSNCGKAFDAKKQNQFYCCRACFKERNYEQLMEKKKYARAHPIYPAKRCDFCGNSFQLDFDPIKNPRRYDNAMCPCCHVTNIMVWQNSREANSHQIIQNLVLTGSFLFTYTR